MKRSCIIICLFLLVLCGCKNTNNSNQHIKIYGGDIIKYYDCIFETGNLFTLPVILDKKVESISVNSIIAQQSEYIELEMLEFDSNSVIEYNGYYVYFLVIKLKNKQDDIAINTSIEKIVLEIDNEQIEYITPDFKICNLNFLCNSGEYAYDKETLLINSGFTGIYGFVPNEKRSIGVEYIVDRKIKLLSYELLDYLSLKEFKLNDKIIDANNINMSVEKQDIFDLEHFVDLNAGVTENNIIKTSMILKYEIDNQKYIWIYPAGVYIWKDYQNRSTIKEYIDNIEK